MVALAASTQADVYLHNMRGSNNRLDEARRDRNNANRMFDSQNNNRGGNNVGSLYFYASERLPLEWTNQHGCGNDDNECQLIVQYMCDDRLRDGVTTRTIPQTPAQCANGDCNNDARYGMHESYDYYMNCKYRKRNMGLFNADRNLNGRTARFTRQNNNGNRNGYECPEERDNYPYWHPTPWIDLAVMTDTPSRHCAWYQAESENVKGRQYCSLVDKWYHHMIATGGNGNNGFIPNTEQSCLALNAETSQMMTFLSAQALATTQQQMQIVATETARCDSSMLSLQAACTLAENVTSCAAYTDFFGNASKFVTVDAMEAACPVCPDSGSSAGLPLLHPHASCHSCGPSTCGASAFTIPIEIPATNTSNATSTCAAGSVMDSLSSMCIVSTCAGMFVQRTGEEQEETDTCRQNQIGTTKILVDQVLPMIYECATRNITTTTCLASSDQASWETAPSHNKNAPSCTSAPWSRANHLGNGMGGQANMMDLIIPPDVHERCTLRVRYNITTKDYGGLDAMNSGQVNSTQNKNNGNNPAKINIGANFGVTPTVASMPWENGRGYLWRNNPKVSIFDFSQLTFFCPENYLPTDAPQRCMRNPATPGNPQIMNAYSAFCPMGTTGVIYSGTWVDGCPGAMFCNVSGTPMAGYGCQNRNTDALRNQNNDNENPAATSGTYDEDFRLQLAINTNQFGRTFQDRTHTFAIRALTPEIEQDCRRIHALNVRGKRGNVVQTFPGTEYDFVPNSLEAARGDCIHFQWTGSNTNPNNNDGQGKQGTDRSNIVVMEGVRGQGGRGVISFGGHGAGGTTWTTKDMEPGYEGYVYNSYPTMMDVQCGGTTESGANFRPNNVPYSGWKCCSDCSVSDFSGSLTEGASDCPTGFTWNQECQVCVRTAANCNLGARTANPTQSDYSGVGFDSRDPGFIGYESGAVFRTDKETFGRYGTSFPEHIDNITEWGVLGLDREDWIALSTHRNVQFGGEMSELDDSGTYFDLGVKRVDGPIGVIRYLCTRNNNFSNRSQKGTITVTDTIAASATCSGIGCVVSADPDSVTALGLAMGNGSGMAVSNGAASLQILPGSLNDMGTVVGVQIVPGAGLSDGQSDVVAVTPGDLESEQTLLQFQLEGQQPNRRDRRAEGDMESGIWVQLAQSPPGSASVSMVAQSPDSMVLQNMRTDIWKLLESAGVSFSVLPYLCYTMKWGSGSDSMLMTTLDIPASGMVGYEIRVPAGWVDAFNAAMWSSELIVEVGFPSESDITPMTNMSNRMCSQPASFTGTPVVDPESGKAMAVTIPVSPAFSYGAIYKWPITPRTTACFEQGIGCDTVYNMNDRQTIEEAECSSGTCTLQQVQAGGYYQVSNSNHIGMIVGVTLACVIIGSGVVGSALYFRRNPEKWDAVKQWGPNSYKQLQRSMQNQV